MFIQSKMSLKKITYVCLAVSSIALSSDGYAGSTTSRQLPNEDIGDPRTVSRAPSVNRPAAIVTSDAQNPNDEAIARLYQSTIDNEVQNPPLSNFQYRLLENIGFFNEPLDAFDQEAIMQHNNDGRNEEIVEENNCKRYSIFG